MQILFTINSLVVIFIVNFIIVNIITVFTKYFYSSFTDKEKKTEELAYVPITTNKDCN